jgi:hypothetical protein
MRKRKCFADKDLEELDLSNISPLSSPAVSLSRSQLTEQPSPSNKDIQSVKFIKKNQTQHGTKSHLNQNNNIFNFNHSSTNNEIANANFTPDPTFSMNFFDAMQNLAAYYAQYMNCLTLTNQLLSPLLSPVQASLTMQTSLTSGCSSTSNEENQEGKSVTKNPSITSVSSSSNHRITNFSVDALLSPKK